MNCFEKTFLIFIIFFLGVIIQKPTPQLKVFIISWSEIFLDFNHLNILLTLIFERSIFNDKLAGIDLSKFSINPPPVIWAAEVIRLLLTNLKISLE